MGVPPMIAFSHGQDARAWGLAISAVSPGGAERLLGYFIARHTVVNPGFKRTIPNNMLRDKGFCEMANPQTRARCPCHNTAKPEPKKSPTAFSRRRRERGGAEEQPNIQTAILSRRHGGTERKAKSENPQPIARGETAKSPEFLCASASQRSLREGCLKNSLWQEEVKK